MTALPTDNKVWKIAPLDTTPTTFNMFATGECKVENKDLIITGSTQVPDFFAVVDGKFVFKKPAPMATIQVPEGFTAYLTITLEGVTNKTGFSDNIQNYVALGVREQTAAEGTYAAMLNVSSKASECFHVDSKNTLELVPLISKTDMLSEAYSAVEENAAITTCPALSTYAEKSFDFGALFQVKTECTDGDATWTELQCNRENIAIESGGRFLYSEGLFLYSSSGGTLVLPPNTIDERAVRQWTKADGIESSVNGLFYITKVDVGTFSGKSVYTGVYSNAKTVVSEDGRSWNEIPYGSCPHMFYNEDQANSYGKILSGNVIKEMTRYFCITQQGKYVNCFIDNGSPGFLGSDVHENLVTLIGLGGDDIIYSAYDGEVWIVATSNCYISISEYSAYLNNWTEPQQKPELSGTLQGLACGNGKFLAVNSDGDLFSSTNKGETWQGYGKVGVSNICGLVFDGEAFYAMDGVTGNVYRHVAVDAIDLTKK